MISSVVRLFPLFLSLAPVMLAAVAAQAQQQPKLEMHRSGVVTQDPSGWHLAVSTQGSFSVRMPIPFNDFTIRPTDSKNDEVTHVIGGKSSEGIRVSAVEMPASARSAPNLDKILADFSSKPGNKVTDV